MSNSILSVRLALLLFGAAATTVSFWIEFIETNNDRGTPDVANQASAMSAHTRKVRSTPIPISLRALPETIELPALEPTVFDPFGGEPNMHKTESHPKALPVSGVATSFAPPALPTPPHSPPIPAYRYFGRMQAPEGDTLTFMAKGDQVLPVKPGQMLDDGFVIEALEESRVRLHYPALDLHITLLIQPSSAPPQTGDLR